MSQQKQAYRSVFLRIHLHLNWLKRRDVQNVVRVVKRRLFIVKRWEAHSLEVATVTLFTTHHDPHGAPLRDEKWLNHKRSLVDEGDGSGNVIKNFHITNLN